jgi:hypothetical protein
MLLEAVEIVLGFLGFGRTVYGHAPTRKNRKWWYKLDEQRLMARRNLCEKLYSPTIVGESYYANGKKYCRRGEIYLHHGGAFCPCSDMALRVSPCSKRDREKLRLAKHL